MSSRRSVAARTRLAPIRRRTPGHPELPLFDFDLPVLVAEVRADFPSLASRRIEVWLRVQPTLAYVKQGGAVVVQMHSVLNHAQTPRQVIAFILRHEFLHTLIPPRTLDGNLTMHPPEYWAAERGFPDRVLAWGWLRYALWFCLRFDKKRECTRVTRRWKARMRFERPSFDDVSELCPPDAGDPVSEQPFL